jgi:hypothetical protein
VISQVIESAHHETEGGDIVEKHIDPEQWRTAVAMEADRILAPSPELKEAVEQWWDALGPRAELPDDRN